MCGRFTDQITWAELRALYQLAVNTTASSNLQPRYDIAPTDDVDFVDLDRVGNRKFNRGRWWLVPYWATAVPKAPMFNARVETIDTTPAFRDAFTTHRCLIPADGYFEWTTSLVDGKKDSGCCNYRPRAILLCRPLAAQPLAEALLEGSGEEAREHCAAASR
jgi:putative SOS response-associated peptidase YedK